MGYRGEIKLRFKAIAMPVDFGPDDLDYKVYEIGDRVGQIMILPFPKIEFSEEEELSSSERGVGGYGSTN